MVIALVVYFFTCFLLDYSAECSPKEIYNLFAAEYNIATAQRINKKCRYGFVSVLNNQQQTNVSIAWKRLSNEVNKTFKHLKKIRSD